MRRIQTIVTMALSTAVLLAAGLAYHRKQRVPCFLYIGKNLDQAAFDALASRPGWQARPLEVSGGARLRGLLRKPSAPSGRWILFIGGNSDHLLEDGVRFIENVTAGSDWGGAVWAYRSYDGSTGSPDARALLDDAFEAYSNLIRVESAETGRVHVVGFSLGASVAVGLFERGARVASLTLLAPATELDMGTADEKCRDRFGTLEHLDTVTSPTLVIHGTNDETLPISGSRRIVARLGGRARLIEHANLGHLGLLQTPVVMDEVRAFVASQ
jgi:pimeloyl-ACP methyl ester carboxylesterase